MPRFAASIVRAKGPVNSGASGCQYASIISYVTRPKRSASVRLMFWELEVGRVDPLHRSANNSVRWSPLSLVSTPWLWYATCFHRSVTGGLDPETETKENEMKILMVLISHDQLGNTGRPTGFWLEEFAAPISY